MSYYTKAFGKITLAPMTESETADVNKKITDLVAEQYEEDFCGELTPGILADLYGYTRPVKLNPGAKTEVEICTEGFNAWNDEYFYGYLRIIAPYCDSGWIEFVGEDETYWAYSFSFTDKAWNEIPGKVTYNEAKSVKI